jgi:preprotein translocase subunit SecD
VNIRVFVGLLVAALAFAVFTSGCGGGGSSQSLGGPGVVLTWQVEPYVAWQKLKPSTVEDLAKILRARMNALGAKGTVTADQQRRTVSVHIDGAHIINPKEKQLLGSQAKLELYDLEPALLPPSIDEYGFARPTKSLAALLGGKRHGVKPPHSVIISCSAKTSTLCPGDPDGAAPIGKTDYYLFKYGPYPGDAYGPYPDLTGANVDISRTRQDFDPTTGKPVLLLGFTRTGDKAVLRVTRNEAIRGRNLSLTQHLAIVLNNKIRSFPQIDFHDTPHGIDPTTTGLQITGLYSLQEAKNLALVAQSGALPARLVLVSQRNVD